MGDTIAQTRFESVYKHSNNSLLARGNTLQSDEDSMKLDEFTELCTNLQNMILDLDKTKTTQRNEIDSLNRRVKKLEKRNRRKGMIIDADDEITLVNDADNEIFDVDDLGGEEMFIARQNGNVVEEVVNTTQLAERLQAQEQEELSDAEKATLFQQLLEKRRKHFTAKRAKEKRNKPPIKAQQRKIIPELVEGKEKRAGKKLEQEIIKKQKVDDDKEKAELKQLMETILDKEVSTFLDDAVYADLYVGRKEERIVRIKSLFDVVGITAAHVCVNAAQLELLLLVNFKENMLSGYYCICEELPPLLFLFFSRIFRVLGDMLCILLFSIKKVNLSCSKALALPDTGYTCVLQIRSLHALSHDLEDITTTRIVMANPNPEDPNVPNEDVPEEDPYHLLDYDKEEDPEMDIEEEEPEEDLEEDDENEDVDIEEDDDAEIIFPYEVQGDQTPPPRDESSNSEFEAEEADDELKVEEAGIEPEVEEAGVEREVEEVGDEPEAEGADPELEAEEPDGAPEATIGTGSQRPFAVRDFPMGFHKAGEFSTACDPQKNGERFYLEMVHKGAVPKPPYDDEGSEHPRKTSKKSDGDEGPSDPRGPLM
nr:hypothetical protein [Tanacetum cinerariifolium]